VSQVDLGTGAVAERGRRRVPWRRLGVAGLVAVALVVLVGLYAAVRFLPAFSNAQEARASLRDAISHATNVTNLDQAGLAAAAADVADAQQRFGQLDDLLKHDPLIGLLRNAPIFGQQIRGADDLVAAGDDVVAAANELLTVGDQFLAARDGSGDPLPRLVALMQQAAPAVQQAQQKLTDAEQHVDAIPDGLLAPIIDGRDELRDRLDRFLPALTAYSQADDYLPTLLGANGPRHYLVLAEDPAELRPTGGFMGTYGIVTIDNGAITTDFHDIYDLDRKPGISYVEPPRDLKGHLLGNYSWQLADANWSPDYPTSAQEALTLYTHESGDSNIDGVMVLTTYAIDRLLTLTGPVTVPEYGVTVHAGNTLYVALANTRTSDTPGVNRKAFLDYLASDLMQAVRALPATKWQAALKVLDEIRTERQAMVWLPDPQMQAHVVAAGWDGALRQDAGDYLMAVDANVAPVGKLNSVVTRQLAFTAQIDAVGNAHDNLQVTWANPMATGTGPIYDVLRATQHGVQILGNFTRIVVPERSRLVSVSGGSTVTPIDSLESQGSEAGRDWFGNYLMIPPGETTLDWQWIAPYVAIPPTSGGVATYNLVVQKQPGTDADPLTVSVQLPPGAQFISASDGAQVNGDVISWQTDLQTDVVVQVQYQVPPAG
jgi:Protein of unknown function (DUF4012)